MKYYKSDITPKIGDKIATGKFGQCVILDIIDGELFAENLFTKETGYFFASDCDLLDS